MFILPTYTNAKIAKKKWCSGLKVSKIGIYALGCDLAYDKPYYILRGKNWIYSGDTFGFVADNSLNNHFKEYNIKLQISIIKGKAQKITTKYSITGHGTIDYNTLTAQRTIHGVCDAWSIWNGKIYVKSKKGCIIQIKMSQKYTTSKKWKSSTIKVKVKKKPLF
jgi:hypothetical protein